MDYRKIIGFGGSVAVALILAAAGLHYDAKALFYAGAILLAVVLAAWLFLWAHPLPIPASGPEITRATEEARERQERRRKIIDQAREMVAAHELQVRRDWWQTIRYSPSYAAVRPHLSAEYLEYQGNPLTRRTVAAGAIHQPPVDRFLAELDRLEREWGLS